MTTETLDNANPVDKDMAEEANLKPESQTAENVQPADDKAEDNTPVQQPLAAQEVNDAEIPTDDEAAETAPSQDEASEEPARRMTKEDILARLKEIAVDIEHASRPEVNMLKQVFYKIHNAENENARKAFIEAGNKEEDFIPTPDPTEEEFKKTLSVIKEKHSEMNAAVEKQKEMNYQVKLSIIEELKDLIASPDDPNKNYAEFKRLQQQWNEVTLVPQNKVNELWKSYQANVEKFYDLLKLNNEFREYDFKKNLETKIHLCEEAERLEQESDVVSAFRQLQKLHQEYRDAGPVAKEKREEIWNRFKAASTAVNRRHQQHFEELKKSEQENLDKKTVICEIVEGINYAELTSYKQWDNKTREIISLQDKWKAIGYAPQKLNVKIFGRFRKACDEFFNRKAEFYKGQKTIMNDNLSQKRALCERAEALKDSTDWKATADEMVKLQKEWKTIGPVSKKYSNQVWERFIAACDYFFDQKNKATSSQRNTEADNLSRKKAIIDKMAALVDEAREDIQEELSDLQKEWNAIGHVPFKEKDKVYKQYRDLVDQLYKPSFAGRTGRRTSGSKFRQPTTGTQAAETTQGSNSRERDKLLRHCEILTSELHTYENNLGFLNATSKSSNALIDGLHRNMDRLKQEIQATKDKIKAIDESEAAKAQGDAPKQ